MNVHTFRRSPNKIKVEKYIYEKFKFMLAGLNLDFCLNILNPL